MALSTAVMTDERAAFAEALRDFAQRECGTQEQRAALTNGYRDGHNQELYARLGELGYIGCCLPERYGGAGGGTIEACVFFEEAWYGRIPIFAAQTSLIVAKAVERFGTEAQKDEILTGICRGEVASIAMSEPDSGSDVGSLACFAAKVPGGYVINGQKTWISNAHHARRILLVCRTARDPASKHAGITMLDIPAGTDGVEVRGIETMGGQREVNDVFFTDAFVPAERLVGVEGEGWRQLMEGLNFERLIIAASSLGQGARAFDDVLGYVKERRQFGRPIGSFQALKHRLADLSTELECTRLLVYDVARRTDEQPEVQLPREASMAKLKATEVARRVSLDGMQMMGGYGYTTEYDMARHVQDAVAATIYAGTSEIQREIIGRTLGL